MSTLSTTKLSSKGQIVIPEEIREELSLHSGAQFIVIAQKDVVILKLIHQPAMSEFDDLIVNARKQAKASKLSKKSLAKIIKDERKK